MLDAAPKFWDFRALPTANASCPTVGYGNRAERWGRPAGTAAIFSAAEIRADIFTPSGRQMRASVSMVGDFWSSATKLT